MANEVAIRTEAEVITQDSEAALKELETRFALAVRQRELLAGYIKKQLQPDKHFYSVNDSQKPSLTKEGAEIILLAHSLKPHYSIVSGPDKPPMDNSPYQITILCQLEANGKFGGEGIGSASSYVTTKSGNHQPRQKDPGLCYNATLKMAQKSAYIAATLNATAASEFFTQDLEDGAESGESNGEGKEQAHICPIHHVPFKLNKWKKYSHPIEGTNPTQWCNEDKLPKATVAPEEKQPAQGEGQPATVPPPSQPEEKEGTQRGWAWVEEALKLSTWSEKTAISYIKATYKVPVTERLEDVFNDLGPTLQKRFTDKLNELVEANGK